MNKILSISIAAYNVEQFIEKALDSYVQFKDREKLEILVIDDGSTDNTPSIVKQYENKFPDVIKLITQKNAGPGSTVNTGMKNATGKYFRMIDGDDWVKTEELESYINFLEKNDVDMVVTNYTLVDNKTNKQIPQQLNKQVEYNQILDVNEICNNLELQMHNVTYKTKILKENNIMLDNGFYTDVEYLLLPIPFVNTIAFLENYIYMYRISLDTQSISITSLQKNVKMHEIVLNRLLEYYEKYKKKLTQEKVNYMSNRIVELAGTQLSIWLSFKAEKQYKQKIKELFNYIKENNSDIYIKYKKKKTVKILEYSKFTLYRIVSYLHRKKIRS